MGGSSFCFCNNELLDRVEADRAEPDCVKRSGAAQDRRRESRLQHAPLRLAPRSTRSRVKPRAARTVRLHLSKFSIMRN
jgi:hypothetical protein